MKRFIVFFVAVAVAMAVAVPFNVQAQQVEKLENLKKKEETKDYVILKLDGEEIKRSDVDKTWYSIFPEGEAPPIDSFDKSIMENVLRGMVSEKLMMKEAEAKKIPERQDVKDRLEAIRRQVVIQAMLDERNKKVRSEEHLKKVYEEKKKQQKGKKEYHARHILLSDEKAAKELYKKLKKKEISFEEAAKTQSTDKGSAVQGGDLGWFTLDRMVPEFSKAVAKLDKEEISKPVKSDFGWHIIRLEDTRPLKMPPFEQVKAALEQEEINKANEAYVEGLLKQAKIEYFDEKGNKKKFPLTVSKDKKKKK